MNPKAEEEMGVFKSFLKKWPKKKKIVRMAPTGTMVRPVRKEMIPEHIQKIMNAWGKTFMSRNSTCLCGSGKRFKKCCMINKILVNVR